MKNGIWWDRNWNPCRGMFRAGSMKKVGDPMDWKTQPNSWMKVRIEASLWDPQLSITHLPCTYCGGGCEPSPENKKASSTAQEVWSPQPHSQSWLFSTLYSVVVLVTLLLPKGKYPGPNNVKTQIFPRKDLTGRGCSFLPWYNATKLFLHPGMQWLIS